MFDLSELEHLLPDEPSPEYNEQLSKINDYLVRIKPEVPAGILERLSTEYIRLNEIDAREMFLSGLYLGANLILALSQPPARIPRR
ncbi:hypothetical protein [Flavonifractor sp. An10]|uniref:hypothetical protein n=1 Tax=Flavonifractor sp. An10 TaxID=1965537 RepID=UPI0013A634F2|nr:hypothetical protein [Flavonifractor sp. An10]